MAVKLSYVVPVFNVAPFIKKCVDSLLAQDYSDYEIILVDDGSTDESGTICDEYASPSFIKSLTHSVIIKVIHQANGGLSAARNAGLKVAKGDYVCFVDSDDYWEENVLGGLMKQIEQEKLDVLRFDYLNVNDQYEVYNPNKTPRYIDKSTEMVDGETYVNTRMGYACYAVMFIMRREIVPLFTDGIHFEDVEWLPRMMLRVKRVNSTTATVYNYMVRQGSITKVQGDKIKIRKNLEDRLTIVGQYKKYIEQYPNCQWLRNMRSRMVAGILTDVALNFYTKRNEYIERMREFNVFPLTIADQGKTYSRRAHIINLLGPRIYCSLMHMRK